MDSSSLIQNLLSMSQRLLLAQWFSSGVDPPSQGTFSSVWRHFSQMGGFYWHLLGRVQDVVKNPTVCQTPPHNRIIKPEAVLLLTNPVPTPAPSVSVQHFGLSSSHFVLPGQSVFFIALSTSCPPVASKCTCPASASFLSWRLPCIQLPTIWLFWYDSIYKSEILSTSLILSILMNSTIICPCQARNLVIPSSS